MKKYFLLMLTVVFTTSLFAQNKIFFGVRGGLTSASMRGDAVNNLNNLLDFTKGMITTNSNNGFFVGPYVSIPVGNNIAIEPAISYAQKGYEMRGQLNVKGMEFLGANARASLNLQYIDLPVLVKANIKGLQLFVGPQLSYLTDATVKTTAGVLGFNLFSRKMDADNQFNQWDAAITAGVGYQFINGLNISAAYDHGLARVDKNQNLNSYNKVFKVGLGMRL